MNDSDKMRAEFEAWAKANDLPTAVLHSGGSSGYVDMRTAWAFEGWRAGQKAEREQLESLLPVGITDIALCGGGQRIEFYIVGDKAGGEKMLAWLRERMKERGEG